jgi:hypothetical protein
MFWRLALMLLLAGQAAALAGPRVLIVADEFPAMERLAAHLRRDAEADTRVVAQTNLPPALAPFDAVCVYIHGRLLPASERAFVDYAEAGGRLILLHHSISSGKRTNALWFPFLGVELLRADLAAGGYQWIEPAELEVVNLATNHFVTARAVRYPERLAYHSAALGLDGELPAFRLPESEVYLNHRLTGPRTVLLGFRYRDARSGRLWMQDTAGWYKPAGKGWVFYFKPGHGVRDFENPAYAQILVNAVAVRVEDL